MYFNETFSHIPYSTILKAVYPETSANYYPNTQHHILEDGKLHIYD